MSEKIHLFVNSDIVSQKFSNLTSFTYFRDDSVERKSLLISFKQHSKKFVRSFKRAATLRRSFRHSTFDFESPITPGDLELKNFEIPYIDESSQVSHFTCLKL